MSTIRVEKSKFRVSSIELSRRQLRPSMDAQRLCAIYREEALTPTHQATISGPLRILWGSPSTSDSRPVSETNTPLRMSLDEPTPKVPGQKEVNGATEMKLPQTIAEGVPLGMPEVAHVEEDLRHLKDAGITISHSSPSLFDGPEEVTSSLALASPRRQRSPNRFPAIDSSAAVELPDALSDVELKFNQRGKC